MNMVKRAFLAVAAAGALAIPAATALDLGMNDEIPPTVEQINNDNLRNSVQAYAPNYNSLSKEQQEDAYTKMYAQNYLPSDRVEAPEYSSATRSAVNPGVDVWHPDGRKGPPNFHHGGNPRP